MWDEDYETEEEYEADLYAREMWEDIRFEDKRVREANNED